ncbi:MAG: hypothetical protein V5A23_09140 [Halobacteriales archaeon]
MTDEKAVDETASGATGDSEVPEHPETDAAPTPAFLTNLRERRSRQRMALSASVLVGLVLAWVHWLGLIGAGVLVGLASRDLPRALAGGLAVGVLALVVHVAASPVMGPAEFLALTPAAYVTVGGGLGLPVLGALVRGIV